MRVILKETIESLGIIGSEVDVAKGYARNYLLPKGKAVAATPANRKMIEQQKAKIELQMAKERKIAEEMAERISGTVCTITAKVSDKDRLYGSVTARDIADALSAQGVEVKKQMILLSEPIKELGSYKVGVRVYSDIAAEIEVNVTAE